MKTSQIFNFPKIGGGPPWPSFTIPLAVRPKLISILTYVRPTLIIFRFALSFGLDALKNREAVAQLHREGILVAVTPMDNPNDPTPGAAPLNLPFLEILAEFTNKLLKQDKKVVLNYLDRRIGQGMPSR